MRDFTTTTMHGFVEEIRADAIDGVEGALNEAEAAARDGRWVAGYVSYEAAPAFDRGLQVRAPDHELSGRVPLVWFGVFRSATTKPLTLPRYRREHSRTPWTSHVDEEDYVKKVRLILNEIDVGTVYQVNFTNAFLRSGAADAETLYRELLLAQQPAYGSMIRFDEVAIVSASPELFVEWDGTLLRSRPMKGTARRGRYQLEDQARAAALANSAKESAENIMIVDLIRNDMGKVAEVGTVVATELRTLEAYPNVWQLVSEIQCRTRGDVTLVDIFAQCFRADQ